MARYSANNSFSKASEKLDCSAKWTGPFCRFKSLTALKTVQKDTICSYSEDRVRRKSSDAVTVSLIF